eukprot:TRINITY_DN1458_c0_g2_i1.p1 TRINITY_DN1458_c0_g2~~TRINITY_DN1458_c0_g2_i1.p1  ORF type:complete len:288 (+),score=55.73 TRINITY_DN1458_c0_g2_i1:20-883(+)
MSLQSVGYADFKLIKASVADGIGSLHICNTARKNAVSAPLRQEISSCLAQFSCDPFVRVVILSAEGKVFSSGIDLGELSSLNEGDITSLDAGRRAVIVSEFIRGFQACVSAFEKCPKPVIAAIHGACIGAGIDIITACDLRLCSKQAIFSVREAKVGLAADVGTLQRLPKVIGCDSWVRDLAYTGRDFGAEEALRFGLVQEVAADAEALMARAKEIGLQIAANSPLAVSATKASLNFSRDHSVAQGLEHVVLLNQANLQAPDPMIAAQAFFQKEKPSFPDLPKMSKL